MTKGSAAALFVGTYLPGGGTTMGMKTHLEDELRRRNPKYEGIKTYKIPAAAALEIFAEKYPDLSRDQALQKEARKNLIHYSTTRARGVRADAVGQGQADVVLLLPRRRRALHLDADADLAGLPRAGLRRRPAGGADPPPRRAARRGPAHGAVLAPRSTRSWSPRPATTSR